MATPKEEIQETINALFEHLHADLKELNRRFNRIELSLMMMQAPGNRYVGICLNAACGAPVHPHWDEGFWQTIDVDRGIAQL